MNGLGEQVSVAASEWLSGGQRGEAKRERDRSYHIVWGTREMLWNGWSGGWVSCFGGVVYLTHSKVDLANAGSPPFPKYPAWTSICGKTAY